VSRHINIGDVTVTVEDDGRCEVSNQRGVLIPVGRGLTERQAMEAARQLERGVALEDVRF
jgi:hypothetical protein